VDGHPPQKPVKTKCPLQEAASKAAKRREIAAHGASRGSKEGNGYSSEGAKEKLSRTLQHSSAPLGLALHLLPTGARPELAEG